MNDPDSSQRELEPMPSVASMRWQDKGSTKTVVVGEASSDQVAVTINTESAPSKDRLPSEREAAAAEPEDEAAVVPSAGAMRSAERGSGGGGGGGGAPADAGAPQSLRNFKKALLEPMEEFLFMDPNRTRVTPLQKWTVEEWERRIAMHPREAAKVVHALVLSPSGSRPMYPKHLARRALSLEAWEQAHQQLLAGVSDLGVHAYPDELVSGRWSEIPLRTQLACDIRQKLAEASKMSDWQVVLHFQCLVQNYESGQGHHPRSGPPGSAAAAAEEALELGEHEDARYLDQSLLSQMIFDREFPLGVEEDVMTEGKVLQFAIRHSGSGCHKVKHQDSGVLTSLIYLLVVGGVCAFFWYLFYNMYGDPERWTIEQTIQDTSVPGFSNAVVKRGQARGRVASLLNAMTFSLLVNASLDKFGLIDPSTSTVLIGMTLGGTWGFVLDNMLGTDEGFREYIWSPMGGMNYAMGCLYTQRFARYIVTILFDMFFTVILFKQLYSKLVKNAGFTVSGREWIANGFVSTFISVLTFEVYANMTRFQWAYPSGTEDLLNQWISGPTMVLCVVIMCMVYLTAETRTRVGEPGINEPTVKLTVTAFTFCVLLFLSWSGYIDPSETREDNKKPRPNGTLAANVYDVSLPLKDVCGISYYGLHGFVIFFIVAVCCLSFVIFATSAQSLSGLLTGCCGCLMTKPPALTASSGESTASKEDLEPRSPPKTLMKRKSLPGTGGSEAWIGEHSCATGSRERHRTSIKHHRGLAQATHTSVRDKLMGKVVLFFVFLVAVALIVILFTFHPIYQVDKAKHGERNTAAWLDACRRNDKAALAALGLS